MIVAVWRTPNGGTVITRHDPPSAMPTGWRVPGASEWLTRDLHKVAAHMASGHYSMADDAYRAEVLAWEGIPA